MSDQRPNAPTRRNVTRTALAVLVACCTSFLGCASIVARPLPPKVQVESVRAVVMPGGETRFRVRLDVQNPNDFSVSVQNIEAHLRVEDQAVATANLADPVVLAAAGDSKVEIEARPDFVALGNAFDRILKRLALRYDVTGYVIIGTKEHALPSDAPAAGRDDGMRLNFSKSGEMPLSDFVGRLR